MFTNARIVQIGAEPAEYHREIHDRGDVGYVIGSGTLRTIAQCPRRWRFGYESPPSESKDFGSLIDCLFLTPERFNDAYILRPVTYESVGMECPKCHSLTDSQKCKKCGVSRLAKTIKKDWNGNATECADWAAENKGREIITQASFDASEQALRRLNRDPIIKAFVDASDRQVWLEAKWLDAETGMEIPVKCLIDLCPRADSEFASSLADLKTTRNGGVPQWARFAYQQGYHIQAALYTDVYEAATKQGRESWCWILLENYPPFETGKRLCSGDLLAVGRAEYRAALATYARCLKTNQWPGYDDKTGAVQGWTVVEAEDWMKEKAFLLGATEAEPEGLEPEPVIAGENDNFELTP